MTQGEARRAGQADPQLNRVLSVFAVMQLPDKTYTYGQENMTMPKSKEEALARPTVVERWTNTGFDWSQVFL